MKKDNIEKAKHQVGDVDPTNPNYLWTEYAPGKFDWKNKNGKYWKGKNIPSPSSAPTAAQNNTKPTAAPAATTTPQQPAAPAKVLYDAPKPKVVYQKNTPKELVGAPIEVPETWKVKFNNGKVVEADRKNLRKLLADTNRYDNDKLLKEIINNPSSHPNMALLGLEEAMARGIDENKIKIDNRIIKEWKKAAEKWKMRHKEDKEDDNNIMTAGVYNSAIGNFNVPAFKAEFGEDDFGWMNKKDPRVQKHFNKLATLKDRQQYDAVVDLMKREDPNYFGVEDQLNALSIQMDDFIEQPADEDSAVFVSSGAAGAGKTYKLRQLLEQDTKKLYDPDVDSDPTADDIDAVMVASDIDTEKDFNDLLNKYNGKLIIFDDKDKALVSNAVKIKAFLKNIADENPKNRIIEGKDGKPTLFKGKLLFITNKSFDDLVTDEDKKAIFSRFRKNDIRFTLNENLELLEKRYKTMGKRYKEFTPAEEKQLRQEVYELIIDNIEKIDPDKFTIRKFNELMKLAAATVRAQKKANINANFQDLFSGSSAAALDWKRAALRELNKGMNDVFEKSNTADVIGELSEKSKKRYRDKYKKNPTKFKELFGQRFVDLFLDKEAEDDEVVKSIVDDFGSMSIDEAEKILF